MMKKILIALLIVIGFSMSISAQTLYWIDDSVTPVKLRQVSTTYPLPITLTGFNFNPTTFDTTKIAYLNKDNVFTGTNIFPKAYIDSLVIRIYALDTGTNITRNILPQTTRLYNFGGSSNYWLTNYTQNLYVDTIKKSVVSDSLMTTASYKQKTVVTVADSTIDCNLSNTFKKTLSANKQYIFTNFTEGQTINIYFTNTASNYTVTFPNYGDYTVQWEDNTAPIQTTGAKTDLWSFIRIGNIILGAVKQNFY